MFLDFALKQIKKWKKKKHREKCKECLEIEWLALESVEIC